METLVRDVVDREVWIGRQVGMGAVGQRSPRGVRVVRVPVWTMVGSGDTKRG